LATAGNFVYVSAKGDVGASPSSTFSNRWELDGRELQAWQLNNPSTEELESTLRTFHGRVPIDEPFERIAQALDEACQASYPVAS
jgi:hypothetical protein